MPCDDHDRARRCYTWRGVHCCPCGQPDDCVLNTPVPIRLHPVLCGGEYGPDGRWREHCRAESDDRAQ